MTRTLLLVTTLVAINSSVLAQDAGGEKYALLIGVRKYRSDSGLTELRFSEKDVEKLAEVLKETGGYRPENVRLLTQSEQADDRFLPRSENLRRELELVLANKAPADTVLIALAGHGVQFKGDSDAYFCPSDAQLGDKRTLLSLSEVYKQFEKCKAGGKLLLCDACRNDPVDSGARSAVALESVTRPQKLAPPGGVAALYSCTAGQRAFERPELGHGVFFHFVIDGLKGSADQDKDGQIDALELARFTNKRVYDYVAGTIGERQEPEFKGTVRSSLPLVRLRPGASDLAEGDAAFAKHEYERAIAAYAAAIRRDPKNAEAYYRRAYVQWYLSDYNEIKADVAAALKLEPRHANSLALRAMTLVDTQQEYERAIDEAHKVLRFDPKTALAYLVLSSAQVELEKLDDALENVNQALKLQPENALFLNYRGNTYRQRGEWDKAAADFAEAIRLDPKLAFSYGNRATVHNNNGDHEAALKDAEEAIRCHPKWPWGYYVRCETHRQLEEPEKAMEDVNKAIELYPREAWFYHMRGTLYVDDEEYDKAITDYTRAIRLSPKNAQLYNSRAEVHHRQENYDDAITDLTKAIELKPEKAEYHYLCGQNYFAKEEYRQAIANYNEAIRRDPQAIYYNNRGVAFTHLENGNEQAVKDYTEAIKLDPKFARAYLNRSNAYQALGKTQLAERDKKKALELDPNIEDE